MISFALTAQYYFLEISVNVNENYRTEVNNTNLSRDY